MPLVGRDGDNAVRILLVEDHARIRELEAEALNRLGFQVATAASAEEAIRLLEASFYHLLLTDIRLAGRLTGIDLAHHVRCKGFGTKTLLVGAHFDGHRSAELKEIADDFLRKPYMLGDLQQRVLALLDDPPSQKEVARRDHPAMPVRQNRRAEEQQARGCAMGAVLPTLR